MFKKIIDKTDHFRFYKKYSLKTGLYWYVIDRRTVAGRMIISFTNYKVYAFSRWAGILKWSDND